MFWQIYQKLMLSGFLSSGNLCLIIWNFFDHTQPQRPPTKKVLKFNMSFIDSVKRWWSKWGRLKKNNLYKPLRNQVWTLSSSLQLLTSCMDAPLFTKAENHQDERKKSWFFLYLAPASLNECLSLCFLTLKMTFTPSCTSRFLRKYSHSNLPYIWFHEFFTCQLIICIFIVSELSQQIWFPNNFFVYNQSFWN